MINAFLPPTKEELRYTRLPAMSVCLSVSPSISKITKKNACIDLDEILRVDRSRDVDELINF